ncbi:MAG: hypothetical protein GXP49_14440 [Deltaproteobacteria bacterium]|nr:hypothetical protein [Deltaproteobacteria bacterium]
MTRKLESGLVFSAVLSLLSSLLLSSGVWAQTGVSDDRVSLPEGPGSLEGVGENVEIDPNMGTMRYSVNIKVPEGYPGMTPGLVLSYSSGNGGSVVGMGWSMTMPYIERMTSRGLPEYDLDDEFAVNGGEQLVLIPGADPPVYRARFEKGFVRYTWKGAGDGKEGYWTAEYPDGRIGYFGAEEDGTLVQDARVSGAGGTFRYHLVEMVDRFGHKIRYDYSTFGGNYTLVQRIGWVHDDNGDPVYYVTFNYEDRNDLLSDCKAGFNELLQKRLARINVFAHGQRIRYYELQYEDYEQSGGFTRLTGVQMYGLDGTPYPVHETFTYSHGLGVECSGANCKKPYTVEMGSIGVDLKSGDATLLDINGDSLPDVIDTSQAGAPHRIFINVLQDGSQEFAPAFQSAIGTQSGHDLSSPYVQVMDVDGDGFTDMINSKTGQVLHNLGTGDWAEVYSLWTSGDGGVPDLNGDFDPSDGELRTIRFLDYDNDKRIDLIRSVGAGASNTTTIYRNLGNGGFQSDSDVDAIGAGFEEDNLELNDMNGDGLLDVVQVTKDSVRYRLNLGWGKWDEWKVISGFDFTDQEKIDAELEDMNGDALADLVLVSGNVVRYWLNRNGDSFDPEQTITSDDIDGEIPTKTPETTVLFADINGNGSSDVLWIDQTGKATYLEMFPERPNLMVRVENGLGKVTKIDYRSSVLEKARDTEGGDDWNHPLPFPMSVVTESDEWNDLTKVHQVVDYTYHQGFYDGKEKQFRGYEKVETHEDADEFSEEGLVLEEYELGDKDPYRSGLLLKKELRSGGRSLNEQRWYYGDCEVAGVPDQGLRFPVRFICLKAEEVEGREGRPQSEWPVVRTEYAYDGYGNVVLESQLGVVTMGGGACQPCSAGGFAVPCGPQCLGDEQYSSTVYASPKDNNDAWILRKPIRVRSYGKAGQNGEPAGDMYTEKLTYYDGEAFTGLPLGKVTHGIPTRVVERKDTGGATVTTTRNRLDEHGNVVESIGPLGTQGGNAYRRIWTMDTLGLNVVRSEMFLEDEDGPYQLRREITYDTIWDLPVEATSWMLVRGGAVQTARNSTTWSYDVFGRLTSMTRPGEKEGFSTQDYEYDLGNPVSRIITRKRSRPGGSLDLEHIECYDGQGKKFQSRELVGNGKYKVSGFTVYNSKGDIQELFQEYMSDSPLCDLAPPAGTLSVKTYFDASGRVIRQTWPKVSDSTSGSNETRTDYAPLAEIVYDMNDTEAAGPYSDTPTITYKDGLGRTVAIEQYSKKNGDPIVYRMRYDELGRLTGIRGPDGNLKTQEFDLRGRLVKVDDPDRGVRTYEYDDAGNRTKVTDARVVTVRQAYDGEGRLITVWDEDDEDNTKVQYRYDTPGDCPADKCTNVVGVLATVRYPLGDGTFGVDWNGYDIRGANIYVGRKIDSHMFELFTEYDNSSRPVANIYPSGLRVDYDIDGIGRLTSVPGYVKSVEYDNRGQLARLETANGVVTERTYDERLRLASLVTTAPGGDPVLAYTYHRDSQGNILEIEDGRADDGHPMGSAKYEYDALYHLTKAVLEPDKQDRTETINIQYGVTGNILSKTSSLGAASPANVGGYQYGGGGAGPHAVTKAGNVDFTYDSAGYMLTRGDSEYTWDSYGRMAASVSADGERSTYSYGPTTDRLVKRDAHGTTYYVSNDFEVRNGVAVTYIRIDHDRIVKVVEPGFAANILSDIAPAEGADDSLTAKPDQEITAGDAWLAQAVEAGIMQFAGDTEVSDVGELLEASVSRLIEGGDRNVTYLHGDHLGGTVAVTDKDGKLVERREYYPNGQVRYSSSDDFEPYGFTGKEMDRSTGLVYFGARYMDPWTGRWISPDLLFDDVFPGQMDNPEEATNSYQYSRGNPVNDVDRDGQFAYNIVTGIVGAVTGAVMEVAVQKTQGTFSAKIWTTRGMLSMGKILFKGLIGGISGALTFGASIPFTIAARSVEIAVYKNNMEASKGNHDQSVRGADVAGDMAGITSSMVSGVGSIASLDFVGLGVSIASGGYYALNAATHAKHGKNVIIFALDKARKGLVSGSKWLSSKAAAGAAFLKDKSVALGRGIKNKSISFGSYVKGKALAFRIKVRAKGTAAKKAMMRKLGAGLSKIGNKLSGAGAKLQTAGAR